MEGQENLVENAGLITLIQKLNAVIGLQKNNGYYLFLETNKTKNGRSFLKFYQAELIMQLKIIGIQDFVSVQITCKKLMNNTLKEKRNKKY